MIIRKLGTVLVGAALLVTATACSGSDDDSDSGDGGSSGDTGSGVDVPVDELLDTLATGVIVPAYTELVASLDGLTAALDGLCATPSPAALDAARTAWDTAAQAWQATRPVGVGPAMDRRLMSTVWYPIRPDDVDELVAGTEPITPESLDDGSATARGLAAVERLLFEPDVSDQGLTTGPAGGRRCTYAAAATTLAGTASREVLGDWTGETGAPPYTEVFAAGVDGDPQASLAVLVNELAHSLQTIDDQGLRGIALAEAPDDLPENQQDGPAGHRVADLQALLGSVRTTIEGPSGDDGLGSLVASRSTDTADRLDEALAAASSTVGELPGSVPETLDRPDDLAAAAEDAAALKVVFSTETASVLGVTIGFSDADGDS